VSVQLNNRPIPNFRLSKLRGPNKQEEQATLNIRVESELLTQFQAACYVRKQSVSAVLRKFMAIYIQR
jgi:hypothetical protein